MIAVLVRVITVGYRVAVVLKPGKFTDVRRNDYDAIHEVRFGEVEHVEGVRTRLDRNPVVDERLHAVTVLPVGHHRADSACARTAISSIPMVSWRSSWRA